MPKYRTCDRPGCEVEFDYTDHRNQRFCSKSCAKIGTRHRHQGAESERPGVMAQALKAIQEEGLSYKQASKRFGIPASTIHLAAQRSQP